MWRDETSCFFRFGYLAACLCATSISARALEPFPPAAVDEWIGALKGGYNSFDTLTTERMMLALAGSDRLAEVSVILSGQGGADEREVYRKMDNIGDALGSLAEKGHLKEAATVDAELIAQSPRLRWNREVFDSALRLADANEVDALVRLAETSLLVPGCDRAKEFDIRREQAMSARTVEVPPIDNPALSRATTLLPMVVRVGGMARFRALAEERVATVPEDFKSVSVLTLATLLDTGDDPKLWKRIADAEGFFRGRDFVALKNAMQLCYHLKIPAPHLCEYAERIYEGADHYGTSFQRYEFALVLSALWKDVARIDEAKRLQTAALESLSEKNAGARARFFEEYAGVLAVSLDDEGMLPELDRWMEFFSETFENTQSTGDKSYRLTLTACEWALALELPEPVKERWFRLADQLAGSELQRISAMERPTGFAIRWHFNLLLSAGMRKQAEKLLTSFSSVADGKETGDLDPEDLRAELAAAEEECEPFSIPDSKGTSISSVHWVEATEYVGSRNEGLTVADVFPSKGGEEDGKNDPYPDVLGVNLVPSEEWSWHRGSSSSGSLVPWESKEGSIRMGYRGANAGGSGYQIRSGNIPLDRGQDYLLSGRLHAYGRCGVKIEFIDEGGSVASSKGVIEHLSSSLPGERWFRLNLVHGESGRVGVRVPPDATAVRLVLTNSLTVQSRWSDLFVGRLTEEIDR